MSGKDLLQVKIKLELTELASSINDVVKKFKELQRPVVESHQKVPRATEQLDKVSRQTEAAAHTMLDMVEKITEREQEVITGLNDLKGKIGGDCDPECVSLIDDLVAKADSNCNDAFVIMDALQFQDITTQQMDHAASLLEEIEGKLDGVMNVLHSDDGKPKTSEPSKPKRERAFDPHADMFEKKTDQAVIDSIFSGGAEIAEGGDG